MTIASGSSAVASDFITKSERNATRSNDSGRVPQLESDGQLSTTFLKKALTIIPHSPLPLTPVANSGVADLPADLINMTVNTTAYVGQIVVPFPITVNKISTMIGDVNVTGTMDITIYSEDGQTQEIAVTTATITGAGIISVAVSAVELEAGIHYLLVNTNGTLNVANYFWNTRDKAPFGATNGLDEDVSSEPIIQGTLTITAGTPPATITPTSITGARPATMVIRLDN